MFKGPPTSGLFDVFGAFGEIDINNLVKVGEVMLSERLACLLPWRERNKLFLC